MKRLTVPFLFAVVACLLGAFTILSQTSRAASSCCDQNMPCCQSGDECCG